jgi:hypothetical protein
VGQRQRRSPDPGLLIAWRRREGSSDWEAYVATVRDASVLAMWEPTSNWAGYRAIGEREGHLRAGTTSMFLPSRRTDTPHSC